MSAEKTPEWLVDLLYAGEEEDEAGASPPEFDLSDEERASAARTRAMLTGARGQLSLAAPSDAVRSAILEQARTAAAAGVARVAAAEPSASAPARRGPSAREPGETLWSRSRTSSVAQIVAVALALVASAALLSSLQNKQHAPAAFDPVAEIAQRSPAPADQLAAAPTTADAPAEGIALNQEAPAAPAVPAPDPELLAPPAEPQEKAARGASDEERGRRDTPPMPSAPMKKTDSLSKGDAAGLSVKDDDLFGGNPAEEDAKRYKEAEAAPRTVIAKAEAPELDDQAVRPMREVAADKDAGRQFNSPESKAPAAAKPAEPIADAKPTATRAASRPADSASGPALKAAAEETRDEGASEQRAEAAKQPAKPRTATIDTVRADFKRADYRSTVTNADQLLGSGQGTADQRAEIMDLKAQALSELGQTAQADQLMRDIERQYPDYYRKNNLSRRKEAPSKAKKRMYNFVDSADTSESY